MLLNWASAAQELYNMIADIIFIVYFIFTIGIFILAIHPKGIALQQEFAAFRTTKNYCLEHGIRWP